MTKEEIKELSDNDLIQKIENTSYYLPEFFDLLGEVLIRLEVYSNIKEL